jgi:hypothetical protein
MSTVQEAIDYVKTHKKFLIEEFCNLSQYPPSLKPFTLFMAGSPGAGKTEFSRALIREIQLKDFRHKILRLDVDELRDLIPFYTGNNSDQIQPAVTLLFDKIFDRIHQNCQNALVDGTFSGPKSLENVQRALNRSRNVGIIYLYQDPFVAWEYTKKREKIEGRTVPKEVFIRGYFESRKNVIEAKDRFGDRVEVDIFIKDKKNDYQKRAEFNVKSMDQYLKEEYTSEFLLQNLPDTL